MPRLRFVKALTEEIKAQLSEIHHGHADFAFRNRAHAILLSAKGITVNQLRDIFEVDRGRRLSARVGKAKAVTATARKIAVLFYNAMRFGVDYRDPGADHYERQYRERGVKQLHRRAAEFGFTLQSAPCVS